MARSAAASSARRRKSRRDARCRDRRGSPSGWACLQDLLAKRRGRRADLAGVFPDALDRPAGVAPVTGRHVLGNGGVLPVPASAQMNGDALAFMKNLDAAGGQPRLDLGAGEAVGDGIIVGVERVTVEPSAEAAFAFVGWRKLAERGVDVRWRGGEARLPPASRSPAPSIGPCQAAGHLMRRYRRKLQPNNLARIAHPQSAPLASILLWGCQRGDLIRPTAAPANPRMTPGGIIPLWGARSSRNRGAASSRYEGRHHPGIRGRLPQESARRRLLSPFVLSLFGVGRRQSLYKFAGDEPPPADEYGVEQALGDESCRLGLVKPSPSARRRR